MRNTQDEIITLKLVGQIKEQTLQINKNLTINNIIAHLQFDNKQILKVVYNNKELQGT